MSRHRLCTSILWSWVEDASPLSTPFRSLPTCHRRHLSQQRPPEYLRHLASKSARSARRERKKMNPKRSSNSTLQHRVWATSNMNQRWTELHVALTTSSDTAARQFYLT